MRQGILDILMCLGCRKSAFSLEVKEEDELEVRTGRLLCNNCNAVYKIDNGIADFLEDASEYVRREQKAISSEEYLRDDKGNQYKISRDSIWRFEKQFLLLPQGDGSAFFKRGGCFQSIAKGSHRFYDTLDRMRLLGNEKVLSLGDGFGYASYRFSQRGSSVVAVDIGEYLIASDLYIRRSYFDRIFSDMHSLPFLDDSFDVVFCSACLHHSKNLKRVFSEMRRVLKPRGRIFVLNESARGALEKVNPLFEDLNRRGHGDTAYTMNEWRNAARASRFQSVKIDFLSIADDYIVRQAGKDRNPSPFLSVAHFFKAHPALEKLLLFFIRPIRILFRPKSWRMICYK